MKKPTIYECKKSYNNLKIINKKLYKFDADNQPDLIYIDTKITNVKKLNKSSDDIKLLELISKKLDKRLLEIFSEDLIEYITKEIKASNFNVYPNIEINLTFNDAIYKIIK